MKTGVIFESLDEVYEYYNHKVVKIVNLAQYLFYADICGVQADWVGKSIFDGRLIAYYGIERTKDCWKRWLRHENDRQKETKNFRG